MTATDAGQAMRVIQADGWPGGPRIIEGLRPANCIHRRRLRTMEHNVSKAEARSNLCRLCEYEAPRLAKTLRR